jgi:hypothetical protein
MMSRLDRVRDALDAIGFALVTVPAEVAGVPIGLPPIPTSSVCVSCSQHRWQLVYGEDPDGLVLCRECRSPLFYCDIGGQG